MSNIPSEGERPRRSLKKMQLDAITNQHGLLAISCPACGCRDSRVTNVWTVGGTRKRLRRCRNCGTPITTLELPIHDGYDVRVIRRPDADD